MIEKKIEQFLSSYLETKKIKNTNWSITKNVKNSYIYTDKNLISVSNLKNIILVATKDSIMATDLNKSEDIKSITCLLYTSPSPRDATLSRMPSSA